MNFVPYGVVVGRFSIIEQDCKIGKGTRIGDYCKIHRGSEIGKNCRIDDYTNTSGAVAIGDDVMVKRMTCLTQGSLIENGVFIGPGVMIIHEKNVSWMRGADKVSRGVHIESGAIIGGRVTLCAGVTVGKNAIIGSGALVTRDCEAGYVYAGVPAKRIRPINISEIPRNISPWQPRFDVDVLREYLPDMEGCGSIDYR